MSSAALSDYADNGLGFPVFRAPYFQKNASLAAFIFSADMQRLSTLCDNVLNVSPDFDYKYMPISSSVMLVFADMFVSSRDERDAQVGLIPETEIGFWMLTLAMKKTRRGYIPSHLAWFLPYIFVDEGNSIATGREVFGFNKQLARIEKPERSQKPEFTADVFGFKEFGADKIAQWERLIQVRRFASPPQSQPGNLHAVQSTLVDDLLSRARIGMDRTLVRFVSRFLNDPIPLVFLKQFRDAQDSRKACYQQIIEARMTVETFLEGGIFLKPYMLNLEPLASHPLAQNLGLEVSQGSKVGVWMKVDFILGNARAVNKK
jgi:hypothetical protein